MGRPLPRPFSYGWGGGQIVEEVSSYDGHYEATLQLLHYEGGHHDGYEQIRFCMYSPRGAFLRLPMMVGPEDIAVLRDGLKETPRLRAMLKELVAD